MGSFGSSLNYLWKSRDQIRTLSGPSPLSPSLAFGPIPRGAQPFEPAFDKGENLAIALAE
jgi:hypothetical protein